MNFSERGIENSVIHVGGVIGVEQREAVLLIL